MSTEVKVPTLGESVSEATIGQWLKQPGETVAADEPIASLETDKVAIEVMAPVAGVMGTIEAGSGAVAPAPVAAAPAPAAAPPAPAGDAAVLSPAVRRAVLEHGIDPATIKGTGKDGRITKEDVLAAAAAKSAAPAPAVSAPATAPAPASGRAEERVKMTRLRQTIARRLKEAQDTAALLTTFNDVDMSAVIAARDRYKDLFEKKHGVRLGFMGFFAKAACLALKDIPAVNAYIEGDEIVYHDYVDISVAVSAPNGLVTPVVRDAQDMSFAEIEKAIAAYGKAAREGSLKLAD
ncbi:MAG TPA: 2-oxo acid dehydrogenase subunit E2, partial [Novosphingobium sp.]|nr:2-oxo acid dehydrogenase subunit E2 [Novosphingobium sp.]